jgi:hypothetical protein
MGFNIPEGAHLVDALGGCITTNGGWDSTPFISLKNCHMAWLVLQITNATAFAHVLTPLKSAVVAGTSPVGLTATTEVVPIWSNMATATSDRLVKRTSAIAYTCDAGAAKQMVVFQIDPANLGLLAGVPYDCVGLRVGAGGGANDFISGLWVLEYRNAGPVVSQPTAVVD